MVTGILLVLFGIFSLLLNFLSNKKSSKDSIDKLRWYRSNIRLLTIGISLIILGLSIIFRAI
jgi:hypothetical protein